MFTYKKIPYIKLIPIILITIILVRVVYNIEKIGWLINEITSLLSYFILGFCIAYLLNPLMTYIEKKIKIKRALTITIIYTLFIGFMVLMITLITPNLVKSLTDFFNSLPTFIEKSNNWINSVSTNNKYLSKNDLMKYVQPYLTSLINGANNYLSIGFNTLMTNLINIGSFLIKLLSGIIISIYLLKDKESFIFNIKKFTYSLFSKERASSIITFGRKVNVIFKHYVVGKLIDSMIIGIICFIALLILRIPYALLIGLIVGLFNMIPYFGNFIGMVPSCLIILFYSPFMSLEVAIVIIIINMLDGWYISPKILGDSVGLSPLLIILGIAIGGGLFGILGMFLGVPIIAVIKTILEDYIENHFKKNSDMLEIDIK